MIRVIFISFIALVAITTVSGYSGGAPPEACDDMTPKHPFDPQKSAFPYTVTVTPSEVKAGEKVQITISGAKEKTFKGFFLQVRSGDKAVGDFPIPDTDKYAKVVPCHGAKQSGVTHKNSISKKTLTLEWIAPAKLQGKVNVYATVAKDGEVFWARQKQAEFKVN